MDADRDHGDRRCQQHRQNRVEEQEDRDEQTLAKNDDHLPEVVLIFVLVCEHMIIEDMRQVESWTSQVVTVGTRVLLLKVCETCQGHDVTLCTRDGCRADVPPRKLKLPRL